MLSQICLTLKRQSSVTVLQWMTTVVKETFLRIPTMSGVTLRKEAIAAVEESSQVDMAKETDISKVGSV